MSSGKVLKSILGAQLGIDEAGQVCGTRNDGTRFVLNNLTTGQSDAITAAFTANGGTFDPGYAPFAPLGNYPAGSYGADQQTDATYRSQISSTDNINGWILTQTGTVNGVPQFTGALPQPLGTASDPQFRDLKVRKIVPTGLQNSSSLIQWGTGVGANSTPTGVSIAGNDMAFTLGFTPSTTPAANQTLAFIPWSGGNGMFTNNADVDVIAQSRTAAINLQIAQASIVLATAGANGITLVSGFSVAPSSGVAYLFRVRVYPQGV